MRRVAAIVLPDLLCEIARSRAEILGPLGVILEDLSSGEPPPATAILDAVSEEARRLGVRRGQSVIEASALAARLSVQRVAYEEVAIELGCVAEIAINFAPLASIELERGGQPFAAGGPNLDTVWLDVTGAAHLVGGEEQLLSLLVARVTELGHAAIAAIADGPMIAQALARWGAPARGQKHPIAAEGKGAEALSPLPLPALPLSGDVLRFLAQLGLKTAGDLVRLPSAGISARLGREAPLVMSLLRGVDDAPLCPYEPPRALFEESSFEEGIESSESLLFVIRGMTSRLGARLLARGEAAGSIDVIAPYDRSIARLRLGGVDLEGAALRLHIDLPAPLSSPADLFRAVRTKLERAELCAPAVGLRLELSQITPARSVQLDLSRDVAVDPDRLPALLAELSAEIGAERLGTLEIVDAHRPESRSRLAPADTTGLAEPTPQEEPGALADPTRLLPEPIPLGRVQEGSIITLEGRRYCVERLSFELRLHAVEWWTPSSVSRDYARAWLVERSEPRGPSAGRRGPGFGAPLGDASPPARPCGEAFVFVDRSTGEAFLQGWRE